MAGLHDRLPAAHYVSDLHDPLPPAHYVTHTWVAMCSCGWRGRDERTERDAEYELRIHQEDTKEIAS